MLGGLLLLAVEPERVRELCGLLRPRDFYSSDHMRLFEMLAAHAAKEPLDVLGLADHLLATGQVDRVGGLAYATSLPEHVPTTDNLEYYAGLIREKAARRELMSLSSRLRQGALHGVEIEELLSQAKDGLESLAAATGANRTDDVPIGSAVYDALTRIHDEQQAILAGQVRVLTAGFRGLEVFNHPRPTDLVVIGARPAMGKTQLMLQILVNMARQARAERLPGVIYLCSLEMARHQLLMRVVSTISSIPYEALLNPCHALADEELQRVDDALHEIAGLPIYINDQPSRHIDDIRQSAVRLRREHGAVLAIGLDYLQLAQADGESRTLEVTRIAYGAKALAKDLSCIFLVAAQLNRGVEARSDKRPTMGDLNESGGIEQAADMVLLLYRDEYYNADTADPGVAEILCRKNRNGRPGTARLAFTGGTFKDLETFHHGDPNDAAVNSRRAGQPAHQRRPAPRGDRWPHRGGGAGDD